MQKQYEQRQKITYLLISTVYSRGYVIPIQRLLLKNCLKVPRNHFKGLTYVETLFFCKLVNVRVFNIYHMHELSYLKVKRPSRLLENIRLCYRLKYYADYPVTLNTMYSIIFILFAPSWTPDLDFSKHIPFSSKYLERLAL